jgi:hypothetical protein
MRPLVDLRFTSRSSGVTCRERGMDHQRDYVIMWLGIYLYASAIMYLHCFALLEEYHI